MTQGNPKLRKKTKLSPAKRTYDNTSRLKGLEQNKKMIVEALVALLVEKKGGDVTFKEIADRTGLAERSIFRFYQDKAALHKEMDQYLTTYIEASVEQLRVMDVATFAKNAYLLFDKYESLVLAYIYSPFGQDARQIFRSKLNRLIALKLRHENKIEPTPERLKKIALICSLINAKIWSDLRIDYGFSGADMGDSVKWAIEVLIKEL